MRKITLLAIITLALGACRKNDASPSNNQDKAPDISYPTPTLKVGQYTIITPKNRGGAVPATLYGEVTSIAGDAGHPGYTNGTGTAALFNTPQQLIRDAQGNLYIADSGNNAIRKVTPDGTVTTFAGSLTGAAGYKDAADTSALFSAPDGIAIDASGNLFVSDYYNNAIRKITSSGVVSTFYVSAASFGPGGLCVDNSGNLIVTAQDANQIVKISPAGIETLIAGSSDGTSGYVNATGTAAKFYGPFDVKADAAGNKYVADYYNSAIRRISPAGAVTTFAGSLTYPDTSEQAYLFQNPSGLAVGAGGVIYVADLGRNQIQRVMPDGTINLVAGAITAESGDVDGVGSGAQVYGPVYIDVDKTGTGYFTEYFGQKVKKVVLTGYTLKGKLPPGLTFDYKTGVISGTPTAATGTTKYTVTAFNVNGFSVSNFTIRVSLHGGFNL